MSVCLPVLSVLPIRPRPPHPLSSSSSSLTYPGHKGGESFLSVCVCTRVGFLSFFLSFYERREVVLLNPYTTTTTAIRACLSLV